MTATRTVTTTMVTTDVSINDDRPISNDDDHDRDDEAGQEDGEGKDYEEHTAEREEHIATAIIDEAPTGTPDSTAKVALVPIL